MFRVRVPLRLRSKQPLLFSNSSSVRCFQHSSVLQAERAGIQSTPLDSPPSESNTSKDLSSPSSATQSKESQPSDISAAKAKVEADGEPTTPGRVENAHAHYKISLCDVGKGHKGQIEVDQNSKRKRSNGPSQSNWYRGIVRGLDQGNLPKQVMLDKLMEERNLTAIPPLLREKIESVAAAQSRNRRLRFKLKRVKSVGIQSERAEKVSKQKNDGEFKSVKPASNMSEKAEKVSKHKNDGEPKPVKPVGKKSEGVEKVSKQKNGGVPKLVKSVGKQSKKERDVAKQKAEKELFENPRKDITATLKYLYGIRKRNARGSVEKRRVNIVDEELCDQIIERLGPSLQKHKGCDIIDINPGAAIWTAKLHEYLQPRSHVLMEPSNEMYGPLLQPLIDQPNSTYKLVPKSGVIWDHLEKQLLETFSSQKPLDPEDPRLTQPNDSLLIVGNLCSYPMQGFGGFPSLSCLVIYQFLQAARAHSLFHRYGTVRMLLWVNEEDQTFVVPRALSSRKKASIEAEVTCKRADVIVTAKSSLGQLFPREPHLELEGIRLVRDIMKQNGVETPKERESDLLLELENVEAGGKLCVIHEKRTMKKEMLALESDLQAGKFKEYQEDNHKAKTAEMERLQYLRTMLKNRNKTDEKILSLVNENQELISLDVERFKAADVQKKEEMALQLMARTRRWNETVNKMEVKLIRRVLFACDQEAAFHQDPPLLLWDKRELEPLRCKPNDFYPRNEMALLDLEPGLLHKVFSNDFAQVQDTLQYILSVFQAQPTQSVNQALRNLWPGAYEWLLAECPSLHDPTKGGASDLERIRTRALSATVYLDMTEAWLRWPFRPHRYKLISKSSSTEIHHPDEVF